MGGVRASCTASEARSTPAMPSAENEPFRPLRRAQSNSTTGTKIVVSGTAIISASISA